MQDQEQQIGFLCDGRDVVCMACAAKQELAEVYDTMCKLYRCNIGAYYQSCHKCFAVIVQGRTPKWSELYEWAKSTTGERDLKKLHQRYGANKPVPLESGRG